MLVFFDDKMFVSTSLVSANTILELYTGYKVFYSLAIIQTTNEIAKWITVGYQQISLVVDKQINIIVCLKIGNFYEFIFELQ